MTLAILIAYLVGSIPFALILAQSRALGCPATIGKLVDCPEIALAVRVVVLVEGVEGFDQLADA